MSAQPQPISGGERIKLEPTGPGELLRFKEPSVVAFYKITVTKDVWNKYYNGTIVPWLKTQSTPNAPMEIYLMDSILVVVCNGTIFQPWESISDLDQYVTKLDAERLKLTS